MDCILAWVGLCPLVATRYSEAGDGRPADGLEMTVRICFIEQGFNLPGPAVEDGLYESRAMCRFSGVDLGQMSVSEETTLRRFRHLPERKKLPKKICRRADDYLEAQGIEIGISTVIDASTISAQPSTKSQD